MGKIDSDSEELSIQGPFGVNMIDTKEETTGSNNKIFYPPPELSKNAYISSLEDYEKLYQESIRSPGKFWSKMASDFYFHTKADTKRSNFHFNFDPQRAPVYTKFMEGSTTNVCYNMLDRHILNGKGDKIAFYWEGNNEADTYQITYNELHRQVCKFANALKSLGIQKGDVVAIYMPMVIEVVVSMLACLRIGAVHSVVFAGYSAQALSDRLIDGNVKVLITADGSWRAEKFMALKSICDAAMDLSMSQGHKVLHCVVLRHQQRLQNTKANNNASLHFNFNDVRDKDWMSLCKEMSEVCQPEWVDSEHPMFILYTSGSTGKPKGIVHSSGGYMVFASTVFKYSFDFHPETDVFWCTSDMGWCCAHTNIVYGPLSLGGTSLIFEGTPFYPDITRPWSIIDKYRVSQFYTAPTVLRHLMKFGDEPVKRFKRDSLRVLGTVGEPINPGVWEWYHRVVGNSKCVIVDTYGQTETGGHLLTSIPGATPTKPGAVGLPFFGSVPVLLTKNGREIEGEGEGCLVFSQPWPCIVRTVNGDDARFQESYFSKFPGYYCTGDAARRDADGFFWITGRVDDMLNVSGHLISTTSIETAILDHQAIAEAAVVPVPHEITGQCLHAFVILKEGYKSHSIVQELKNKVREKVGSFAVPASIQITPILPMTRSGKILRRVLVNIALCDQNFGDISTLIDPSVLVTLSQLTANNKQT